MISNYIIYLYTLPKEARIEQIFIFLILFFVLSIICILLDFFKSKYNNKFNN